ncbi:MAG: hypothetical protein H6737_07910 [Alphaproteobacteria bacterium]|nr:hypothetical protein [Alphaproteobacteria bacterium]
MVPVLSIALAEQPVEVTVQPTYRSARSRFSLDNAGSSDISDGHYAVRVHVAGHLRPWMTLHLDATQAVLNLWFEPESRMQRYGRIRLTAGPLWQPLQLRARLGFGQEGIATLSGFERRYHYQTVFETGLEGTLAGPLARLTLGVTAFGVPGRGGSSFDAELAIPEATTFGVVASYNYRHLAGAWEIDAQAFQLDDRNHSVSVGMALRPRVRSAAEE